MQITVVEVSTPWVPAVHEMKLRPRYRTRASAKKGKANSGGNSGIAAKQGILPVGLRRRPRGKTRHA